MSTEVKKQKTIRDPAAALARKKEKLDKINKLIGVAPAEISMLDKQISLLHIEIENKNEQMKNMISRRKELNRIVNSKAYLLAEKNDKNIHPGPVCTRGVQNYIESLTDFVN